MIEVFDEPNQAGAVSCRCTHDGNRGPRACLRVLDRDCQAHDVRNLYVADASSFPSSGGAPFTLTIMANALRIGASIAVRAKRREL
jgi:choline dehydrogenase-like flavoprotein